ncbi:hypothetical protein K470DRAFT_252894 [Piedraia hortae CBS 480.64]|uniref:DNA polymerase epsilon subunit B n=1 Tax=Piedraia hortae CBS 480.64 TaxID=1314780 RepID=A0A6A7BQU5_9PEZI|nr:hypothetical protein K470DRAFT_252894 [Piedraia hortae CBS 480.64]
MALPFSSSPAFATPPVASPLRDTPVLPILLTPAVIRPLAFRVFTKKHGLSLHLSAVQSFAVFIGRQCGSGWRETGSGEATLDEIARLWKAEEGGIIVSDGDRLKSILKTIEAGSEPPKLNREDSYGLSNLAVTDEEPTNPKDWLRVHSSFSLPRFIYNTEQKTFVPRSGKPTLLPPVGHKTLLNTERYNIIYQQLLRNEAFQPPTIPTNAKSHYKITPIANLLGRGGTTHLLFGTLVVAPTGNLALNDPSGSITLDLSRAACPLPKPYYCPGMVILIEGIYQEDYTGVGSHPLGGDNIGGRFIGLTLTPPPVEKRSETFSGGGFGWTDFLGTGSHNAVGEKMVRLEEKTMGNEKRKAVVMADLTLDKPAVLRALNAVLERYAAVPPLVFILMGPFCSKAALAGGGIDAVGYKDLFDGLAGVLGEFTNLLKKCAWVFVPGDGDPWASAGAEGASCPIPRAAVPEFFTGRVSRVVGREGGEVIWTTNPARVSLFGTAGEMILFRDDVHGRLGRLGVKVGGEEQEGNGNGHEGDVEMASPEGTFNGISSPVGEEPTGEPIHRNGTGKSDDETAKRIILSLLPQATLSPFLLSSRPVHWDYAQALSLYPLPHTLVLADAETKPFAITYEGCLVCNPGRFVERNTATWLEYDFWEKGASVESVWVR